MRKLALMLFCTAVLLIQSCQNFDNFGEIDRIDHNPEFAIPLVHSSLSIQQALDASDNISILNIAADGSMSLDYTQEQSTTKASTLLSVIDDFPIAMIDSFTSVPVDIFENLSIHKLHLKEGTLEFEIQSSHTEDLDVYISFPGITQDGSPFEVSTELKYEGSSPVVTSINARSIADFELSMSNGEIEMRYEAYNNAGERVLVDLITGVARSWQYDYIEGVWNKEEFLIQKDTVEIDIFDNWVNGEVNFADPQLHIHLKNSIGFPVQMKIQNMEAITHDGNKILFSSNFEEGIDIAYPGLNEPGAEKTSTITLDKNNSNIVSILNARPKSIIYEVKGIINPNEAQEAGFVSDESQLKGIISVKLPLYGMANNFTLESISDFELDEIDEIEEAEFKIITNNGIPVDLNMQVFFTDEQETVIDSLFEDWQQIMAAPDTGANGSVINSNEQINLVAISEARMNAIQQAKKIKIQANISTANAATTPVRIYAEQEMEVRAGVKLKVNN